MDYCFTYCPRLIQSETYGGEERETIPIYILRNCDKVWVKLQLNTETAMKSYVFWSNYFWHFCLHCFADFSIVTNMLRKEKDTHTHTSLVKDDTHTPLVQLWWNKVCKMCWYWFKSIFQGKTINFTLIKSLIDLKTKNLFLKKNQLLFCFHFVFLPELDMYKMLQSNMLTALLKN